jgi:hypothetical protein
MWNIHFFHTGDFRRAGALSKRLLQLLQRTRGPVRDDLYRSVRHVAHPASHVEPVGLPQYKPAEPDPLHNSAYQVSHRHDRS